MKSDKFAKYLSSFLSSYLPFQQNMSINTIASYRDTFKQLLHYCESVKGIKIENITMSTVSKDLVVDFLDYLETERQCSISTRNQRLSAIHAFIRYVQKESPETLFESQKILKVPSKKKPKPLIPYFRPDDIKILFEQPDTSTKWGRRDLVLLTILYDTGARVQELIDIRLRDVRLVNPAVITLHGKGKKVRQVPIMGNVKKLLASYMEELDCNTGIAKEDAPLFSNQQRKKLTRWGVSYIIKKYVEQAKQNKDFCMDFDVHPHVFRHSKAMHMLQAGINIVYIRDFLGHSSTKTTEVYARADSELKRKAIESAYTELSTGELPDWDKDGDLMDWLTDLCK